MGGGTPHQGKEKILQTVLILSRNLKGENCGPHSNTCKLLKYFQKQQMAIHTNKYVKQNQ